MTPRRPQRFVAGLAALAGASVIVAGTSAAGRQAAGDRHFIAGYEVAHPPAAMTARTTFTAPKLTCPPGDPQSLGFTAELQVTVKDFQNEPEAVTLEYLDGCNNAFSDKSGISLGHRFIPVKPGQTVTFSITTSAQTSTLQATVNHKAYTASATGGPVLSVAVGLLANTAIYPPFSFTSAEVAGKPLGSYTPVRLTTLGQSAAAPGPVRNGTAFTVTSG